MNISYPIFNLYIYIYKQMKPKLIHLKRYFLCNHAICVYAEFTSGQ